MVFIFYSEGGIRKAALRNMPVACFNRRGFSAEKESHRPDLSARSIRRDGRLLAECRWHSATAVAFAAANGIPPPRFQRPLHTEGWAALSRVPVALCNRRGFSSEKESHLLRRKGRRDSNSPEKNSSINKIFSPRGKFSIM